MKVLLSGVNGAMGKTLIDMIDKISDVDIVAGFDKEDNGKNKFPMFSNLDECTIECDVIIDFSHYSAFSNIIEYARKTKTPIVVATTGLSSDNIEKINKTSKEIPVFKTANMSLGVNVIADILKKISPSLRDFDIEIIEKHHRKKKDAPSGTALLLADEINRGLDGKKEYSYGRHGLESKRKECEIGIHAVRGGTIPGEHTVVYAGEDEIIEIKHTALSKKVFANGAIKAARFLLLQKNGLYDMSDVITSEG